MIKATATSLLVMFVLAGAGDARAVEFSIMSDDDLYAHAVTAVQQRNWIRAYGYLMAYIQRNPAALANDEFAVIVDKGLTKAEENARKVVTGAGVDSKMDKIDGRNPSYLPVELRAKPPPMREQPLKK